MVPKSPVAESQWVSEWQWLLGVLFQLLLSVLLLRLTSYSTLFLWFLCESMRFLSFLPQGFQSTLSQGFLSGLGSLPCAALFGYLVAIFDNCNYYLDIFGFSALGLSSSSPSYHPGFLSEKLCAVPLGLGGYCHEPVFSVLYLSA